MERGAWTDARLDDRFDQVEREMRDLRIELREGFRDLRGEVRELRSMVFRSNISMMLGFLGVIATILARGA